MGQGDCPKRCFAPLVCHAPGRWPEFRARYLAELKAGQAQETLEHLRARAASGPLTLLTATRNQTQTHATVLCEILGG